MTCIQQQRRIMGKKLATKKMNVEFNLGYDAALEDVKNILEEKKEDAKNERKKSFGKSINQPHYFEYKWLKEQINKLENEK